MVVSFTQHTAHSTQLSERKSEIEEKEPKK
jgi:hypothetical protein